MPTANVPVSGADETEPTIEARALQHVHLRTRAVRLVLRRSTPWLQLASFCAVGASGYAVNLAVYSFLVGSGINVVPAAVCSFVAALANNYTLNRLFTFRDQREGVVEQGARYVAVSLLGLGANLAVLVALVYAGVGDVPAQAAAIVLVTPISFLGNKLWSFGS